MDGDGHVNTVCGYVETIAGNIDELPVCEVEPTQKGDHSSRLPANPFVPKYTDTSGNPQYITIAYKM
jgi:hypothetical protein